MFGFFFFFLKGSRGKGGAEGPSEGKDQVARVGKVGSLLAQPGDRRGEGWEDRRYVWSSKGVRAGGGVERALMALVAQGRDQKVASGRP